MAPRPRNATSVPIGLGDQVKKVYFCNKIHRSTASTPLEYTVCK